MLPIPTPLPSFPPVLNTEFVSFGDAIFVDCDLVAIEPSPGKDTHAVIHLCRFNTTLEIRTAFVSRTERDAAIAAMLIKMNKSLADNRSRMMGPSVVPG